MPTEAKLTGSDYDLDPNDVLVDDTDDSGVALQRINWILRTWRGEYAADVTAGVDYIGFAERKIAKASVVSQDVLANIRRVPLLSNVSVTAQSQVGRTLSLDVSATWKSLKLTGTVLAGLTPSGVPGDDAPTQMFLALHR